MNTLFAIAAGGALGALMRHGVNAVSVSLAGSSFPWGTLSVNILGSFFMGALIACFAHIWEPPHAFKAFVITGLLGAFTTFSAFSLDVAVLWERGANISMMAYILGSVIVSITALFAAMILVREVAS